MERAKAVLARLEAGKGGKGAGIVEALPLFAELAEDAPAETGPSEIEQALAAVSPDTLTPREALDLIYRLKGLA